MKKILFILAITGLVFSSCGNKKKQDNTGTHVHEDGTVHANDAHNQDAKPNQESFEVKEEGEAAREGESKNVHSGEHEHSHGEAEQEHSHN